MILEELADDCLDAIVKYCSADEVLAIMCLSGSKRMRQKLGRSARSLAFAFKTFKAVFWPSSFMASFNNLRHLTLMFEDHNYIFPIPGFHWKALPRTLVTLRLETDIENVLEAVKKEREEEKKKRMAAKKGSGEGSGEAEGDSGDSGDGNHENEGATDSSSSSAMPPFPPFGINVVFPNLKQLHCVYSFDPERDLNEMPDFGRCFPVMEDLKFEAYGSSPNSPPPPLNPSLLPPSLTHLKGNFRFFSRSWQWKATPSSASSTSTTSSSPTSPPTPWPEGLKRLRLHWETPDDGSAIYSIYDQQDGSSSSSSSSTSQWLNSLPPSLTSFSSDHMPHPDYVDWSFQHLPLLESLSIPVNCGESGESSSPSSSALFSPDHARRLPPRLKSLSLRGQAELSLEALLPHLPRQCLTKLKCQDVEFHQVSRLEDVPPNLVYAQSLRFTRDQMETEGSRGGAGAGTGAGGVVDGGIPSSPSPSPDGGISSLAPSSYSSSSSSPPQISSNPLPLLRTLDLDGSLPENQESNEVLESLWLLHLDNDDGSQAPPWSFPARHWPPRLKLLHIEEAPSLSPLSFSTLPHSLTELILIEISSPSATHLWSHLPLQLRKLKIVPLDLIPLELGASLLLPRTLTDLFLGNYEIQDQSCFKGLPPSLHTLQLSKLKNLDSTHLEPLFSSELRVLDITLLSIPDGDIAPWMAASPRKLHSLFIASADYPDYIDMDMEDLGLLPRGLVYFTFPQSASSFDFTKECAEFLPIYLQELQPEFGSNMEDFRHPLAPY